MKNGENILQLQLTGLWQQLCEWHWRDKFYTKISGFYSKCILKSVLGIFQEDSWS